MPAAPRHVTRDVLAGLTVTLVGLPQCLAYAMMSGLPPAYGLSTAAVPGLVAALAGRSAQVVTGPTNTTGLLILVAIAPFLGPNGFLRPEALPVLATLTLMAGVLRLVFALSGGATLIRFLPESVLVGFTAGAGILIAVMQLDEALGLPPVNADGFAEEMAGLYALARAGRFPAWPAVGLAVAVVAVVAAGRRLAPRLPLALLALVGATFVAWASGLDAGSGLPLVADRAAMPQGWPPGALPDLRPSLLRSLIAPTGAIVLLGTMELAVSARAGGARPDMRREILAQGWANVAGSVTACMPASASLTRSALLRVGGARTRLAAAAAAVLIVPLLVFASDLIPYVPQAALAALLWVTANAMLDRRAMARVWRASIETRILLVTTFVATLVLPLEWAILLGAGLGLGLHLVRTSGPRLRLFRPERGRLVPLGEGEESEVVVLEVSGDLYYAAVPAFLGEAESRLPATARDVVVDLSHAHNLRFAALKALEDLSEKLARQGALLRLAGVDPEFEAMLARTGSPLACTPAEEEPGLSVRRALSPEAP